jgi:hypothetical protein
MPSKAIKTAEVKRKTRIYLAIAALTLVILLATLSVAGKQKTLRCNRLASGEVDCVIKNSILGVIILGEKTIPGAKAASIGQQCPDVACMYRIEIYATQGLIPVNEKYTSNYEQQLRIKEEINNFFTDKTSSFVEMKEETNPYLIGAVMLVILLIWIYLGYLIWQENHPKPEEYDINN